MEKLPIPPDTRVLIVEDNDLVRELLCSSFIGSSQIWTAPDAKSGWDLYQEHNPNIVFMDIGLPDGNGHDLAKQIKEIQRKTHIIMITSSDDIRDKMDAAHNNVNAYITKPFSRHEIKQCLTRYLEERRKLRARVR